MLRSLVNTALRGTYATDAFDDDSVIYWNGVLIIRDRPEAHRKIIRLFETLRTADYAPK